MGILRNRLSRRFPVLGLISDLTLVGAAVSRFTKRGRSGAATSGSASPVEMALAGGAALRLFGRARRRRARRRAAAALTDI